MMCITYLVIVFCPRFDMYSYYIHILYVVYVIHIYTACVVYTLILYIHYTPTHIHIPNILLHSTILYSTTDSMPVSATLSICGTLTAPAPGTYYYTHIVYYYT